jgi:hypothetical protein
MVQVKRTAASVALIALALVVGLVIGVPIVVLVVIGAAVTAIVAIDALRRPAVPPMPAPYENKHV